MAHPQAARLRPLTGLRFIAALGVLLFHTEPRPLPDGVYGALVAHGYMGVSAFFVLSGFILAYNYARDGEPINRRAFWAARVARIYPVYALGLLVALPHFVYSIGHNGPTPGVGAQAIVAAATLTQAWARPLACALNCPGWSLSAEAFFYLAFPFLVPVLVRQPAWRTGAIALGAGLAALAVPLLFANVGFAPGSPDGHGVLYDPALRFPEFVLGVAVGTLYLRDIEPRGERLRPWAGWVAAIAIGAVVAVAMGARQPLFWRLTTGGGTALAFAVLILALACGGGWIGWLLGTPVLVLLGEASYALYILHLPLIAWWRRGSRLVPALDPARPLGAWMYAAAAVGASLLVLVAYEEPMRRRLRALLATRQPGRIAVVARAPSRDAPAGTPAPVPVPARATDRAD